MTAPARVSVLLPVRNGAVFLGEALASLSAQTFADFEAIVVDDGSSDGSAALARAHAKADARFRVVSIDASGIVAALELARSQACGEYLARMDADDVALPGRLLAQVAALDAEPSLAAVGGRVAYVPRTAVRDGARRYEHWLNGLVTAELAARDVFVECPLAHPTLVARASAVAAAGGYRDVPWPEDYDLVLRLWAAGGGLRNVEQVTLHWREHPHRLSRRDPRYSLEAFTRCKVEHLCSTLLDDNGGVVVFGAGPVGKAFARELAVRGITIRAFVEVDPRKLGKRIHGAPVVPVEDAPRYADAFAIGAVSGPEARERIRAVVRAQGRREGVDFVAVG